MLFNPGQLLYFLFYKIALKIINKIEQSIIANVAFNYSKLSLNFFFLIIQVNILFRLKPVFQKKTLFENRFFKILVFV